MASPFSQTMASRRSDFFYTRAAAAAAAVILVLLWGNWFFTSPIVTYETSRKVRITDQELIRERFTDKTSGGAVYTRAFRKRKIIADFAPETSERIKPGQAAYLYIKDSSGERSFTVPAAVVFDAAHPENRKKGRVTLEAEVPENVPNPFEKGTGEKVSIEAGRLTPADMVFRASGLGTEDVPVSPTLLSDRSVNSGDTPICTYKIVNVYPHDRNAFTQGLCFEKGILYEGTGLYGESELRKTELETGKIFQKIRLPKRFFGEGITVFGDTVIQLTWQSHIGFIYNKRSLECIRTFQYPTEGWGITHDGARLIMSDGTSTLYFLDPSTLKEIGRIEVSDELGPVSRLNELEYIRGEIYANVWQTDDIVRIAPRSGKVLARIRLKGLLNPEDFEYPVDVLNGIAYDSDKDRIFVTGKRWPKLFEIEVICGK